MPFQLYAFGSNNSGQLGVGHRDDLDVPTKCRVVTDTFRSRPVQVSAGGNHTLVRCSDGTVYATGSRESGKCGLSERVQPTAEFELVSFMSSTGEVVDRFKDCATTWDASTFLTLTGDIYSCGKGTRGELGQGDGVTCSNSPQLICDFLPEGTTISCLTACLAHTVAVLSNGEVYAWGAGRKGQLGQPICDVWKPRKIAGLDFHVLYAACGRDFTYLVKSAAEGKHSISGSDKWGIISSAPIDVVDWHSVAATWSSMYVLKRDKSVLCWGRHHHSRLPDGMKSNIQHQVAGSEHVLAQDDNDRIHAWGWGEHGNCGPVPKEHTGMSPMYGLIDNPIGLSILGAGCATSWLVSRSEQPLEDEMRTG